MSEYRISPQGNREEFSFLIQKLWRRNRQILSLLNSFKISCNKTLKYLDDSRFWNKSDWVSLRKKIPSIWLHRVSETFVCEPHEFAFFAVKFVLPRSERILEHDVTSHVVCSRFRNQKNRSADVERSVLDDVFVCWVVDAVEHHLVEHNFCGVEHAVLDFFGKEISAGNG